MDENPDTFLPFSDSLRMVKKIDAVRSAVSKFCVCPGGGVLLYVRDVVVLDMHWIWCQPRHSNSEIPNNRTAGVNAAMRQIYLGEFDPDKALKRVQFREHRTGIKI